LKLKYVATIITVLIIVIGLAMISPVYLRLGGVQTRRTVMLTFSVLESDGAVEWCKNLSLTLNTYNLPATVFIVGKIAEQYPQTVLSFGSSVDIGSETYNNTNLTTISDYTLKLKEVQEGKAAVDNAGHLDSKAFRAPYGATDQDIYSLLSRSGILADFSYKSQYNVYQNGQFIKFDATTYEGREYAPDYFLTGNTTSPIIIDFDNNYSITSIESYLSRLKTGGFDFVNASELVGMSLTIRGSLISGTVGLLPAQLNLGHDEEYKLQCACGHLSLTLMEER
jgi:peptidoglycan/xylan/chitin deacetylase (PgdA/CDA1 family)